MFEISPGKVKNCIAELESVQKRLESSRNRLETVHAEMGSLVEGQMDRQIIRTILDQIGQEIKSTEKMGEVLEDVVREYERTEKRIGQGRSRMSRERLVSVDLTQIGQVLEEMGISFE